MFVFNNIHMGTRLRHYAEAAGHGKGAVSLAKALGVGKTTIYSMFEKPVLDLNQVEIICEFYGISFSEFLGIKYNELPGSFQQPAAELSAASIDQKLDIIIEKLNQLT